MEPWLILIILAILALAMYLYLHRTGAFYKIKIRTDKPSLDTICFAYKFYQGSYSEIYLAFKNLNSILKQASVASHFKKIGIYYDDPVGVKSGKQRYAIGIILNNSELIVDSLMEDLMLKNDYNIVWITKINHAVLTEFPCKTFLSIFWSVRTVYPKLKEFIKRNKLCAYPFIESYSKDLTEYIVPLCEQEKFFVPEIFRDDFDASDVYYHKVKEANLKSKSDEAKSLPMNEPGVFIKNSSSSSSTGKKRR